MTSEERQSIRNHLYYAASCYQEKISSLRSFLNLHDFADANLRVAIANLEARALDARTLAMTALKEKEEVP